MDITSILGVLIGAALIVQGITFDKLGNFWDPASILIVVGGTLAAVIASYPLNKLKSMGKHMGMLMSGKKGSCRALAFSSSAKSPFFLAI